MHCSITLRAAMWREHKRIGQICTQHRAKDCSQRSGHDNCGNGALSPPTKPWRISWPQRFRKMNMPEVLPCSRNQPDSAGAPASEAQSGCLWKHRHSQQRPGQGPKANGSLLPFPLANANFRGNRPAPAEDCSEPESVTNRGPVDAEVRHQCTNNAPTEGGVPKAATSFASCALAGSIRALTDKRDPATQNANSNVVAVLSPSVRTGIT